MSTPIDLDAVRREPPEDAQYTLTAKNAAFLAGKAADLLRHHGCCVAAHDVMQLLAHAEGLRERVRGLEALKPYAYHKSDCVEVLWGDGCTCGYDEAAKEAYKQAHPADAGEETQ